MIPSTAALRNTRAFLLLVVGVAAALAVAAPAQALTVTPLTWNVIGLDSNTPASGPYRFPVGARVCTTGAATTATVNFVWDDGRDLYTGDTYINLRPGSLASMSLNVPAAGCADAYFEAEVARLTAAFDKTRRYHITATDGSGTASTPQPRELYVEHLISQNRNAITGVKLDGVSIPVGGTMTLLVGGTYTIELDGGTATQGYNQFEAFINFPNTIFQILAVQTTYSADNSPYVPNPSDKLYADACLWQNDPNNPNYRSCVGGDYKAGGSNVVTTYTIKVISGGGTTQTLNSLLYDFSGSSFHYNADFSFGTRLVSIVDSSSATIQKAFAPKAIAPGGTSTLTFRVSNPTTVTFTGVNFSDTFPSGVAVAGTPGVSTSGCGSGAFSPVLTGGETSIHFDNGTLAPNSVCTINLTATAPAAGSYTNTTEHLFVNTSQDTGNTGSDTLTASSAPACIPGQTLATWTVPVGTTNPPDTFSPGAGSPSVNNTGYTAAASANVAGSTAVAAFGHNDTASWETWGYKNAGQYVQFVVDTRRYSGVTMTFWIYNGSISNGPSLLQVQYNNNDGSGFHTFASFDPKTLVQATWTQESYNFTGLTSTSGSTTFRLVATGGNNDQQSAGLNYDLITFTGCGEPAPPPTISKSFSPDPIVRAGTSTLSFTLQNTSAGNRALTGVAFTDVLPTGLAIADSSASQCGGTLTTTAATRTIALANGTLAAAGSCTFSVTVTGSSAGSYTNVSGFVSATESGANTSTSGYATDSLSVVAPPTLAKAFSPPSILTGGTTSLQFTITNPNLATTLTGVAFTDVLPAGLALAGSSSSQCGGTLTTTAATRTIELAGGTLAANATCTFSVTVAGPNAGTQNNTTSVIGSTEGGNGAAASASLAVSDPVVLIGLTKQISTDGTNWYKSVGLPVGGSVFYRFMISNDGEVDLDSVNVTDPTVTPCSLPTSLAVGDSASCTTAGVPVNSPGLVTNTATASGTGDSQTTTVTSSASYGTTGLSLAKSVTPVYFTAAGQSLSYSYVVTNTGFYSLLGPVTATDDKTTVTCPVVTTVGDGDGYLDRNEAVTCTASYMVTGTDVAAGFITNTASATVGGVTSPQAAATAQVLVPATIAKSFAVSSIALDGTTTLSFQITNASPSLAITGVAFTDSLPSGLVVAATPGVSNTCGGTVSATAGSSTVGLSGGTLAASSSCTVSVSVTGTTAGAKANSVTVSSTEGGTGNTSQATLTVVAPPTVAKAFDPGSVPLGGTTTLSITIDNPNTAVALTGLAFTDSLPAGLVVAATPNLSNTCGGTATATAGATSISLAGGALSAGASCTVSVSVTATTSGVKDNSVSVTSTEGGGSDPVHAIVTVGVQDLAITKSHTGSFVHGQTGAQYTVAVTNVGSLPTDGTTVTVTDTLPPGLAVTAISGTGWGCTLAPLACARTDVLPAGGSYPDITITVDVANDAGSPLTNTVAVAGGGDANEANDTATDPTVVLAQEAAAIPMLGTVGFVVLLLAIAALGALVLTRG